MDQIIYESDPMQDARVRRHPLALGSVAALGQEKS